MKVFRKYNKWPKYWGKLVNTMYALERYIPKYEKEHEQHPFSQLIYRSKNHDESEQVIEDFRCLIQWLTKQQADCCVCAIPNSSNELSPTMSTLMDYITHTMELPSAELEWKSKHEMRRSSHTQATEKAKSTYECLNCTSFPQECSSVILIDDTRVTGMTALEAQRAIGEYLGRVIYTTHAVLGMERDRRREYEVIDIEP